MSIHIPEHLPTVGFKALGCVVGEPAFHLSINGDAVVVVDGDEFSKLPGSGKRGSLMADAFHQASITKEGVRVVVYYRKAFFVELGGKHFLCQGHTYGIGKALPERSGGSLHAGSKFIFGVAGGSAVKLSELFQVFNAQVIPAQVQE